MGTTGLGYEQLNQLAEAITKDQGKFDTDIHKQKFQMEQIRRSWPTLSETDRRYSLQTFSSVFPRCRENAHPQDCLLRIINLPTGEDVQRALRVRDKYYRDFKADLGEELYPQTGWLGKYLYYAKWNKVPLALHFWAALSILGVASRRNFFVDINAAYIWLNQFIVLTGAKANGKSAARGAAKDILVRMNRKLAEMQDAQAIPNARSYQIPMIAGDITPQGLVDQLAEMSRAGRYLKTSNGTVEKSPGEAVAIQICDELSNTIGKGTFGSPLRIPLYTELAFESSYSRATKKDGIQQVDRMAFSVLACTQPGWMRNTIVSDAMEGGFIERANFIFRPESGRMYPMLSIPPLDPLQAEELADFLVDISMQGPGPQLLQATPEGTKYFNNWYTSSHAGGPRDKDDASLHSLERRCIHLLRIASLLCISERDSLPWIQIDHLRLAIKIIEAEDAFYAEFVAQAGESTESSMGRHFIAWVMSQGGRVTKQAIGNHRIFGRSWDLNTRNRVIDSLVDTGQLQIEKLNKGTWYVIPRLKEID